MKKLILTAVIGITAIAFSANARTTSQNNTVTKSVDIEAQQCVSGFDGGLNNCTVVLENPHQIMNYPISGTNACYLFYQQMIVKFGMCTVPGTI